MKRFTNFKRVCVTAFTIAWAAMPAMATPDWYALCFDVVPQNAYQIGLYVCTSIANGRGVYTMRDYQGGGVSPFIQWEGTNWVLENGVGGHSDILGTGDEPEGTSATTVQRYSIEGSARNRTDEKNASSTDPINVLNGGMCQEETDINIPAAGYDLVWGRFYNSASPETNGIVGSRWSHSYDWTVAETTLVWTIAGITNTRPGMVLRMDGVEKSLLPDGTNAIWRSAREVVLAVSRMANGEYVMTMPGGNTAIFETNGLLKGMADAWADRLSFAYTNVSGTPVLASVTHADGRALLFAYSNDRLAGVTGPSTNYSVSYTYSAEGELTNAVKHTAEGDFITSYSYNTNANGAGRYLIRRVNADGDVKTCGYSTNALGATQGGCTGLVVGSSYYAHSVVYNTNNATSTVTYERDGTNAVYVYSFDALAKERVRRITGPGGTGLVHRFDYNQTTLSLTNEVWAQSLTVAATISTTASNQPGWFVEASGLAVDASHRLYVADKSASRIQRYDPASNAWSVITGPGSGFGSGGPRDVAVDSQGNLYVTDPNKHRVLKRTVAGVWSSMTGYDGSDSTLLPYTIATDPFNNLYVGDWGGSKGVRRANAGSGTWQTIINSGTDEGTVHYPNALSVMSSNVLCVSDSPRLQTFSTNGGWLATIGAGLTGPRGQTAVGTTLYVAHDGGVSYGGMDEWIGLLSSAADDVVWGSSSVLYVSTGNRIFALPTEDGLTFVTNGVEGATNTVTSAGVRYKLNDRLLATNVTATYNGNAAASWALSWNTNWDLPSSITDTDGRRMEWEYTNGAVSVERTYPATNFSAETRYAYTSNGLLVAVTNANGHWAHYQRDAHGYPTSAIPQLGPTNRMVWDNLGHLREITLPSHATGTNTLRVIALEPDELGHVRVITWPDGSMDRFAFDAVGNMTNHVDAAGRTNVYSWLPTGKLYSRTRYLADGGSNQPVEITFQYDSQFNVVNVQDALGRAVEWYTRDLLDRPVIVNNYMEGQQTRLAWGLGDQLKQVLRPDGSIEVFDYDSSGRLRTIQYPGDSIHFGWTGGGLLTLVSNRVGVVSNSYDKAGRLISVRTSGGTVDKTMNYGLDAVGNVTNVVLTGSGYQIARTFDAAERLSGLVSPYVGAAFSYDSGNSLLSGVAMSNGITCAYGYDVLDRLSSLTWRDASNNVLRSRSYSYTLAGMISSVDMESGEKGEYSYDSLDRLTGEKKTDRYGKVLSLETYGYDLAGNRIRKTVCDSASNVLMTVNYTNGTPPSQFWTGNRLASWSVAETSLCGRVDVSGYSSEPIGTDDRWGHLWVSNGVGGMLTPAVEGTNFWAYGLTVGLGTQKVFAAVRDMAGNTTYVTNTIRLSVVTNGTYKYNAAGCLTNIAYKGKNFSKTFGLAWDGQYQLTEVRTNGVVMEKYDYDSLGRRMRIMAGNTTNTLIYDGLQVIADLDSTGAVVRSYVWGPGIDNLLAMTVYSGTTNTYYAIKDHLNSVLALTDSAGQIVEQYRYDAWGRTTVFDGNGNPLASSAIGNRYCWMGREYSWKIHAANNGYGLYYFRTRWADPVTGRWLSPDPIGISGGLNFYEAFGSNPVNNSDPAGCKFDYSGLSKKDRVIIETAFNDARSTTPGRILYKLLEDSEKNIPVELGPGRVSFGILRVSGTKHQVEETVEEFQHMAEFVTGKEDPGNLGLVISGDEMISGGGTLAPAECRGARASNIAKDQYNMQRWPQRGHPQPKIVNHGFDVIQPYGTKYDPTKHWHRN